MVLRIDAPPGSLPRAWARVAALSLMLCAGGAALPGLAQGFPSDAALPKECPDLAGTYETRIPAWADKLQPFGQRPRMQTRQLATIQPRGNGYALVWHASREELLAAARNLAQRDAHRYDVWRDRVLRDPQLPLPLGVSGEREWVGRIESVGPVFRGVDESLPLKQCKQGWFLIAGPGRRDGPPDFAGGMEGTRELALWLGRDKDGSLGLRVEERKTVEALKPYRGYKELAVPLWSTVHAQEKWPVAPAQDLSPLRAEELPARSRPPDRVPDCQITGDHEAAFLRRLKANLPPQATIENYSSSIYSGRRLTDGTCDPTPYTVTILAPDAASLAKVADYLRTDPFIRRIDSQEPIVERKEWPMVKFRMMAAP